MKPHLALRTAFVGLVASLFGSLPALAAPVVPPGFTVENALFNNTLFNNPTCLATLPDGRWLVGEKRGVVWTVSNGVKSATALWSATNEVLNSGDRGLISIEVDPAYATNHRVYFFYTVDSDSDGVDDAQPGFARLVRYQISAADSNLIDPASRTVLLGVSWSDGITSASLSHGADCLAWGEDGSLLVSHGDGAHYEFVDAGGHDSSQFVAGRTSPLEDIGSFRSQDPSSLSGKVLRLNPENGHGYASNPFWDGDPTSARSKVWAMGFRNPFRLCVRPGTGSRDTADGRPGVVFVGDVGLTTWEEIDVLDRPGMNFGWPCREGHGPQPLYQTLRPAHHGCDTIDGATLSEPNLTWHHTDSTLSVPYGLSGNCTAGGIFYTSAGYPAHYRDRLFFGDFGKGWLKVATLDSLHRVTQLQDFGSGLEGPVDWAIDPASGDLLYISIYTGQVRRIRYVGTQGTVQPLVAVASATPTVGDAPATITFSSLGSYDPAGHPINCVWSFGDMTPLSTENHPHHEYRSSGEYIVVLTVSNGLGGVARDSIEIVIAQASGFPIAGVLDSLGGPDHVLAAPWAGSLSGLTVRNGALTQIASPSYATWGTTFGSNQEAFVRFDSVTAGAPEHTLLLKVQGPSWSSGAIQVVYAASQQVVVTSTYTASTGWTRRGGPWQVTFGKGDQFGARVFSNGMLVVYKNRVAIGTASVLGWPYAQGGGRVGFKLVGALDSRLNAFGGGDVPVTRRTPPRPVILAPHDRSFFVTGQRVVLSGTAVDDEDVLSAIDLQWSVDLIHNNHTHPGVITFAAATDSFVAENHDDGTGVSFRAHLVATDPAGLTGTATIALFPEIDLESSPIVTAPLYPTAMDVTTYGFTLSNRGRMPAPYSRWAIVANGVTIAQGDTAIAALDSVRIVRTLPALLSGTYTLRAVADTLATVEETNEVNNASVRPFTVSDFPSTAVIDAFDRADGAVLKPWVGSLAGFAIQNQALIHTGPASNYAVWNGAAFGADQEVFVRFDSLTSTSTEHDLLLKVQGTSWTSGAIQIVYSPFGQTVVVNTYTPASGWLRRAGPWKTPIVPGDQLGARAMADGSVRVFRNGKKIGEVSLAGWPFAASGGRIGLILSRAGSSRLTAFGGGTIAPPTATILAPHPRSFFAPGEVVPFSGMVGDPKDPNAPLGHHWIVDRVRAGGVDSAAFVSSALADSFRAEPGVASYRLRLIATDPMGLTGNAIATVLPEIDLAPSTIVTTPLRPTGQGVTTYGFTLSNRGRMPAPYSRWTIVANGVTIAQGDTVIAARDSVRIVRTVASLPPGTYTLRAVADTIAAIEETNESNNASVGSLAVIEFPSAAVVDAFDRADGAVLKPWVGSLAGFAIQNQALIHTGPASNYAVWNGAAFGADQEVFVRFDSLTSTSTEHDLLLKVQGTSWTSGAIQIVYSPFGQTVVVNTYTPASGWLRRAGPWKTTIVPGDQLGARAMADGSVRVFRNGKKIGEVSLAGWPFAANGGRIGLILSRAGSSRLTAFGGGDVRPDSGAFAIGSLATNVTTADTLTHGSRLENVRRVATVELPRVLALSQPFPNPARGEVSLALELPNAASVSLSVYDLQGRRIWHQPARVFEAGRWRLGWSGQTSGSANVAPGVYLVCARIDDKTMVRRVTRIH